MCTVTPTSAAWLETSFRGNDDITKLHFYVHDVRAGPNATTYAVGNASITSESSTSFAQIKVYDDRATAGPDIGSEEVARAQGLAVSADLQVRAFTMNLNFVLTSGEFNGSVISVADRNPVGEPAREMPVVGGIGVFRFARGYIATSTYYDTADYSVLEYTVYATYCNIDLQFWSDM